jgi:hypothetical protein
MVTKRGETSEIVNLNIPAPATKKTGGSSKIGGLGSLGSGGSGKKDAVGFNFNAFAQKVWMVVLLEGDMLVFEVGVIVWEMSWDVGNKREWVSSGWCGFFIAVMGSLGTKVMGCIEREEEEGRGWRREREKKEEEYCIVLINSASSSLSLSPPPLPILPAL